MLIYQCNKVSKVRYLLASLKEPEYGLIIWTTEKPEFLSIT